MTDSNGSLESQGLENILSVLSGDDGGEEETQSSSTDSFDPNDVLFSDDSEDSGEPDGEELEEDDLLDDEIEDEVSDEDLDEELDEEPVQEKVTPGANKRIQKLVAERNEVREALAAAEQKHQMQMQYVLAQLQQVQQKPQQDPALVEMLRHQQELIQELRGNKLREEEENLSPLEKNNREVVRRAVEAVKKEYESKLSGMERRLELEAKMREAKEKKSREQNTYQQMRQVTSNAVREAFLNDVPDDVSKEVSGDLEELYLTYAAAAGLDPGAKEMKEHFGKLLDSAYKAKLAARKKVGKGIKANKKAPRNVQGRRVEPKRESKRLSQEESVGLDLDSIFEHYTKQFNRG